MGSISKVFTFAVGAVMAQPALAMLGDISPTLPDSVCQLVIEGPRQNLLSVCTGTLISPTEVATAAHCVSRMLFKSEKQKLLVKCGYRSVNEAELALEKTQKETLFYVRGVEFAETFEAAEVHIDTGGFWGGSVPHDLARVVLSGRSKLQPLAPATESELQEAMLKTTEETASFKFCMSSGFGINPAGTAGLPFSTRFDGIHYRNKAWEQYGGTPKVKDEELPLILEMEKAASPEKAFTKFLVDQKYVPSALEAGDSGGPLMCSVNNQWKLVGVANGTKLEYTTLGFIKLTTNWSPYHASFINKRIY